MYSIIDTLNTVNFNGLQVEKLASINAKEIRSIILEKNAVLKKHTSPTDAHLLVLEGCISFFINNDEYQLCKHQLFKFPKDVEHWVEAIENSKFLIIR